MISDAEACNRPPGLTAYCSWKVGCAASRTGRDYRPDPLGPARSYDEQRHNAAGGTT